ncbi:BT_3928 family protein [Apibacter sp. HY039]|uniref:BT_3928 family protein n=1 Tax=Apibacter sp. HY039 TaxID=2501476 RepID=UPI000FEBF690|nr:BT_3928 family protein [Apibacter sp. HY039]
MKYITNLVRIVVGIIFIISGFVKVIDPIGFSYKLEEYFGPSVFDISVLHNLALPMSIVFVILEVMLGVFLLLGILKKLTIYSLLILIVFFSFLTFYSAYYNVVTDCGCFGDALKLKPWTSFYKDIALLVMILLIISGSKYITPLFSTKINGTLVVVSLLFLGWVVYQGIAHLPIIDFRPYAVGKNLISGMNDGIPEVNNTVYTLRNLKNNEEKNYTADEYINTEIWKDTLNWAIKDTKVEIIKEAIPNSVHDFIVDCQNNDRTEEILNSDKIAVFTVPFANKLTLIEKAKLRKITNELNQKKVKFVILSNDPGALTPVGSCSMDQTTLKTINRSNPGLMVLKKGIVVAKYHANDFPEVKEMVKL